MSFDSEEIDSEERSNEGTKTKSSSPKKILLSRNSPRGKDNISRDSKRISTSPKDNSGFSTSPRRRGGSVLLKTPRSTLGSPKKGNPLSSSQDSIDHVIVCRFDEEEMVRIFGVHFSPYEGEHHTSPKKKNSKSRQEGSRSRPSSIIDDEDGKHSSSSSSSSDHTQGLVKKSPRARKQLLFSMDDVENDEHQKEGEESEEEEGKLFLTPRKNTSSMARIKERVAYNVASGVDKGLERKQKISDFVQKFIRKKDVEQKKTSGFQTPSSSPELKKKKKRKRRPYHELIKNAVYLGVQPQSTKKHPFLIPDGDHPNYKVNSKLLGDEAEELIIALVCTIQKPFEMGGSFINNNALNRPIDHNIFAEHHIANIWMYMKDEQGELNFEMALYRLYDLMEAYLASIPIYVHCKSGKGRSVMFEILLFSFCFLSWQYETQGEKKKKEKRSADVEKKIAKYWEVISAIVNAAVDEVKFPNYKTDVDKLTNSLESSDKPNSETLTLMVSVCERFITSIRDYINLGSEKRKSSLLILEELVERIHGVKNTAHSSFKSPDCAFLDDLGQTAVYKNICIYMAGPSHWNSKHCESFQLFLNHLVRNKKGWFEELKTAVDDRRARDEGACGHFANTDRQRRNMVKVFHKEIVALSEKYPGSNYSQPYLKMVKEKKEKRDSIRGSSLYNSSPDIFSYKKRGSKESSLGRGSREADVEKDQKPKRKSLSNTTLLELKNNRNSVGTHQFRRRSNKRLSRKSGALDTRERRQSEDNKLKDDLSLVTAREGRKLDISKLLGNSNDKRNLIRVSISAGIADTEEESSSSSSEEDRGLHN